MEFVVRDTGLGIPRKQLKELVGLFSVKKNLLEETGFGLGLSLCNGLVEMMSGKLRLSSELGEGTEIFFNV